MHDLARQLAAHPQWTWIEGMLAKENGGSHSLRVTSMDTDDELRHLIPDLSDAATWGALLGTMPRHSLIGYTMGSGDKQWLEWVCTDTPALVYYNDFSENQGDAVAAAWLAAKVQP